MKLIGCEHMRNCSVSQVLFDLFRAGSNKSGWEIFRYDPRQYLIFTNPCRSAGVFRDVRFRSLSKLNEIIELFLKLKRFFASVSLTSDEHVWIEGEPPLQTFPRDKLKVLRPKQEIGG